MRRADNSSVKRTHARLVGNLPGNPCRVFPWISIARSFLASPRFSPHGEGSRGRGGGGGEEGRVREASAKRLRDKCPRRLRNDLYPNRRSESCVGGSLGDPGDLKIPRFCTKNSIDCHVASPRRERFPFPSCNSRDSLKIMREPERAWSNAYVIGRIIGRSAGESQPEERKFRGFPCRIEINNDIKYMIRIA